MTGPSDLFWDRLGCALIIFALCIGMGGCLWLAGR